MTQVILPGTEPDELVTGTITGNGQSIVMPIPGGYRSISLSISGTFTGSTLLQLEGSDNGGSTYFAVPMVDRTATSAAGPATSVLGNLPAFLHAVGEIGGLTHFRVRSSAYQVADSVDIRLRCSEQSPGALQSLVLSNTELPAAATLADNTANPTVPGVGSFGMVWDGANWDRVTQPLTDTQLRASAVPVSLGAGTNNIGDVDVLTVPADPFGANADASVAAGATGSMQAKLRRLTADIDAIKTSVAAATPAGTNNIGDVDVLTLPADPLGANADAVVAAGAAGSLSAKLRRLTTDLDAVKTLLAAPISVEQATSVDVADGGGSITVDAPVATPVWVRLSDGAAAFVGQKAMAASVPVVIASDQSNLPIALSAALPAGNNNIGDVDVASSALPSGASTSANQATEITALTAIQAAVEIIDDIVSGSEAQVDVVTLPALPAGTNNIGDVDVLTLPADPLGANADAVVAAGAAGSLSAKLRRLTTDLDAVKTSLAGTLAVEQQTSVDAVLLAGSAAIGKLAANSGVDIGDVDVTSLPALPAGTNAIGKLAANSGVDIGDVDVTSVPADPFGANADASVAAGATGSIQAKLRRLSADIDSIKTSIAGTLTVDGTDDTTREVGRVLASVMTAVTGTLVAGNTPVEATPTGMSGVTVMISGTYASFALLFQQSTDGGTTWTSATATRADAAAGFLESAVITVAANNTNLYAVTLLPGCDKFRVLGFGAGPATGTANIRITGQAITRPNAQAVRIDSTNNAVTLAAGTAEAGKVQLSDGTDVATVLPVRTVPATTEKGVVIAAIPRRIATFQAVTAESAPAIGAATRELFALWHPSAVTVDAYITEIVVSVLVTTASTTGGRTNVEVLKITTAPTGGTNTGAADIGGGLTTSAIEANSGANIMAVKTGGGAAGVVFVRQGMEHATQPLGSTRYTLHRADSLQDAIVLRGGSNDGISVQVVRAAGHTALVDQWTASIRWVEL